VKREETRLPEPEANITPPTDPSKFTDWLRARVQERMAPVNYDGLGEFAEFEAALIKLANGPDGLAADRDTRDWLKFAVDEATAWRLIALHFAGNERAFVRLHGIFSTSKVNNIVSLFARDAPTRESLANETWAKVWIALPRLHVFEGWFTNYLATTAKHTGLSSVRQKPMERFDDSHLKETLTDDPSPPWGPGRYSPEALEALLWLNFDEGADVLNSIVYAYRGWLMYDLAEILELRDIPLLMLVARLIFEYSGHCGSDQIDKDWAIRARDRVSGPDGDRTIAGSGITTTEQISDRVRIGKDSHRGALLDQEEDILASAFARAMLLHHRTAFGFVRFLLMAADDLSKKCGTEQVCRLARIFFVRYLRRTELSRRRVAGALGDYRGRSRGCQLELCSFQSGAGLHMDIRDWCATVQLHIRSTYPLPQAFFWEWISK
jgi:hypothetical protein